MSYINKLWSGGSKAAETDITEAFLKAGYVSGMAWRSSGHCAEPLPSLHACDTTLLVPTSAPV